MTLEEKRVNRAVFDLYVTTVRDIKRSLLLEYQAVEKLSRSQRMDLLRMQALLDTIESRSQVLEKGLGVVIPDYLKRSGELAYNGLFYEYESTRGRLDFALLNEEALKTIIETPVAGFRLSERLEGNVEELRNNINNELTRSFLHGDSYQKAAKRLSMIGMASYHRAMRIVRTEGGRVSAVSRQRSQTYAQELGVEFEKVWMAVLDKKTRHNHGQLDGQSVAPDEYFTSPSGKRALQPHMFGVASEDINCRCRTISRLKGDDTPLLRRDNETGEVGEWKNYQEWAESKGYAKKPKPQPDMPELPKGIRWNPDTGQFEIKGGAGVKTTAEVIKRLEEAKAKNGDGFSQKANKFLDWLKNSIFDKPIEQNQKELYNRFKFDRKYSAAELTKKLHSEFGMTVSETSRTRLPQLALEQTYSILKSFENIYDMLPEKIPRVRAIPKTKAGDAIAWYSRYASSNTPIEFGINVSKFLNADILKATVEYNIKSGWFSKNSSPEHIMIHEFGHHIDFQLSKLMSKQFSDDVFRELEKSNPDKYRVSEVGRLTGGYAHEYYKQKRSNTETFAELFAEAYGETPRKIADDFREVFERKAKEVLKNANRT